MPFHRGKRIALLTDLGERFAILGLTIITALLVAIALIVFCAFVNATSNWQTLGTLASILSNVVGAMIGAAAAVAAVAITVSSQRQAEAVKVSSSIQVEVAIYVKWVIGALETCVAVKTGEVAIPLGHATAVAKALVSEPVVYPAIADRIGMVLNPEATVSFFGRLAEARTMVEALEKSASLRPRSGGRTHRNLTTKDITPVAECLITALELARPIVVGETVNAKRVAMREMVRFETINQIDDARLGALRHFPDPSRWDSRKESD